MKKIVRLTESDLTRIVKRIILEDDERRIQLINKFYDLFQDKTMNFYLPNDYTDPIIRQFMVDKIEISEDSNTLTLIGKGKKPNGDDYPGNIKLQYTCNSKNTFRVEIDEFKEEYSDWNDIYKLFDSGIPNAWKMFLRRFSDFKFENDYEMDVKERKDYYRMLISNYKRPFVSGGIDSVGKQMITLITDEMCSYNFKGNAVPKADFASLGSRMNNNLG